jgi:hypothetical protein
LYLSKNKQIIYENAYIHIMEDTFSLDVHHPQHKKDSCTGNAAEGCDRLHGRKNRQTDCAGRTYVFVCGSPSSILEIRFLYRTQRHPAYAPEPESGSREINSDYSVFN